MLLLLVFMQLTRDLFAIAKLLYELDLEALTTALAKEFWIWFHCLTDNLDCNIMSYSSHVWSEQ